MKNIEIKICCTEVPTIGPAAYFDAVQKRLEEAGVEFSDGDPVGGTISRRDDPEDFGMSIWTFTHNAAIRRGESAA